MRVGLFKVHYNLANLLRRVGVFDQADQEYLTAIEIQQHSVMARFGRGLNFKALGDSIVARNEEAWRRKQLSYESSVSEYDRVVAIDATYKQGWNNLGNAYVALDKVQSQKPVRSSNQASDLFGDGPDHYLRKAIKAYDRAIKIDPEYANAKFNRAAAH